MKSKIWITIFLFLIVSTLAVCGITVYYVDPYFHFHKPYTEKFFYTLSNERSQNDGIVKHFDYEGLITGTSMCANFKTSEAEELFGAKFVKVPYSGGSFKEIDDSIETALESNSKLKIVIRGLDMAKFIENKDAMRYDLGEYPTYLYDNNPFNDVKYLFNIDVIMKIILMAKNYLFNNSSGMTTFDDYANWMASCQFGVFSKQLFPNGVNITNDIPEQQALTDDEKRIVEENINENVIKTALNHPEVKFFYFIPPYSAVYWKNQLEAGTYEKQIQAEAIAIEMILGVENIKLFSINNRYDLTTDLNNYKDSTHYGEWINSLLLRYMYDGKYQLTNDNYKAYLADEETFYKSFDYYSEFSNQVDYDDDYYAAEILKNEIYGGL